MNDLMKTILEISAAGASERMCEECGERVATQFKYHDIFGLIPENPMICEPCAERGWDRQEQRKAEDAP